MLCSNASSSSSTSWLDRLRISKGFSPPSPSDHDLDLGSFLSSITTTTTSPTTLPSSPPPPSSAAVMRRPNNLAAALSNLFVMGPSPPSLLIKASRKQSRPRPYSAASAASAAPAADHSSTEVKKKAVKPPRRKRRSRGPPVGDLSTFSKTEVTVIDTSVVGWKTEKVIFRRGTVWKVRDRKVWTAWRKKRKLGLAGKGKEKNLADLGAGHSATAEEGLNALNEVSMQSPLPILTIL